MQAINRKSKAKTSRNRGYVIKYPRIRKEFDKPNRKNRRYESRKQTNAPVILNAVKNLASKLERDLSPSFKMTKGKQKMNYQAYDKNLSYL